MRAVLLALILLAGCASQTAPGITLIQAPETAFARADVPLTVEVTLPEDFTAAGRFTLHADERTHTGRFGTAVGPTLSGYPQTYEGAAEVTGENTLRVSFTLRERKPTRLFYRLHVDVDGRHYWTPERALIIVPQPAFSPEFRDSGLDEAIAELLVTA